MPSRRALQTGPVLVQAVQLIQAARALIAPELRGVSGVAVQRPGSGGGAGLESLIWWVPLVYVGIPLAAYLGWRYVKKQEK